jgi:hypothetical protein
MFQKKKNEPPMSLVLSDLWSYISVTVIIIIIIIINVDFKRRNFPSTGRASAANAISRIVY